MTKNQERLFNNLRPDNYSKLSEEDRSTAKNSLYQEIRSMDWSPLSQFKEADRQEVLDTRHDLLQSLENLNAYDQGRPAKEIYFVNPTEPDAYLRDGRQDCSCYGYWSPSENKIVINDDLVSEGRMDIERGTPEQPDTKLQLIDTIVHEGRHAYQSYVIDHPSVHGDTQEAQREVENWVKNEGKYYPRGLRYYIQPQETDAYRYARSRMDEIFASDLKNEKGFTEYEKFSKEIEADNVLAELARKEGTTKEKIINSMDREMVFGCRIQGINYTYADLKASEARNNVVNDTGSLGEVKVRDSVFPPEKDAMPINKIDSGDLPGASKDKTPVSTAAFSSDRKSNFGLLGYRRDKMAEKPLMASQTANVPNDIRNLHGLKGSIRSDNLAVNEFKGEKLAKDSAQTIERYQTVDSGKIYNINNSDKNFWNHHGNTKEDYIALAEKLSAVQKELARGKTVDENNKNPDLKDCVEAYYNNEKVVRVTQMKDGSYEFEDDGRHRVTAAQELGYQIPVYVINSSEQDDIKAYTEKYNKGIELSKDNKDILNGAITDKADIEYKGTIEEKSVDAKIENCEEVETKNDVAAKSQTVAEELDGVMNEGKEELEEPDQPEESEKSEEPEELGELDEPEETEEPEDSKEVEEPKEPDEPDEPEGLEDSEEPDELGELKESDFLEDDVEGSELGCEFVSYGYDDLTDDELDMEDGSDLREETDMFAASGMDIGEAELGIEFVSYTDERIDTGSQSSDTGGTTDIKSYATYSSSNDSGNNLM